MTRLLPLAALLALAPVASGQASAVAPVAAPAPSTVYAGLYAADGGMLEVRSVGADVALVAHGAPVAAELAALASPDAATDARTEALLDAWITGDLAPLAAAARPSRQEAMTQTLDAYRGALIRGRGEAIAGRVIGTFAQSDGRHATLVQLVFDRGAEWAAFIWDEAGALVTVRRGLPPVEIGTARLAGRDAFTRGATPVAFAREADGRVAAVRVGDLLEAVR